MSYELWVMSYELWIMSYELIKKIKERKEKEQRDEIGKEEQWWIDNSNYELKSWEKKKN